jgi:hypothetical protein
LNLSQLSMKDSIRGPSQVHLSIQQSQKANIMMENQAYMTK